MDLLSIARRLRRDLRDLHFGEPVTHVYNPLEYAFRSYQVYLERYGTGRKEVVLLGMNPGPWGMAQTGIPFGEVNLVRDWLKIDEPVKKPKVEHPKREILGFACSRSEVSGARLWGLAKQRFKSPERFFRRFLVLNYCPLVFMEASGKNRTPDKLKKEERHAVEALCDRALRDTVSVLAPAWVVGIGAFATLRAKSALEGQKLSIGRVLHPSPASPVANRGWAKRAEADLLQLGIKL